MLDTINKMRALVSMKTTLINELRSDLRTAESRITRLEGGIDQLHTQNVDLQCRVAELEQEQAWYNEQDKEMERQGKSIDVPITLVKECSSLDLVEDPDAMWKKGTHDREQS